MTKLNSSDYCCDYHYDQAKEKLEREEYQEYRQKWHSMLNRSMDETKEGDLFLPQFVRLVMFDLKESLTLGDK